MTESSLSRCSPFTSSISSTSITSTPTRRASPASKANLYLVFEHLDIDLMKFIDSHP
ncbi:putative CDK [Corchorus capsularis]|uniref:Putative CDK n=1 Tax=Corchorus capsularis TaxID=210143 RepID=A0A1R3JDV1_COCAP|nr:putative CDK [Corchorus capsularis]